MTIGPIQILVVGIENPENASGEVLVELATLRGRGMIRVIDLLVVTKSADGTLVAMEMSDLSPGEEFEFGAVLGELLDSVANREDGFPEGDQAGALAAMTGLHGMSLEHIRSLRDSLEPGAAAGLVLFEHTWAIPLRDAMRRLGAYPISQGFLTPEAVIMVGTELQAIADAEVAIEVAETIKAAAILDALTTMAQSEAIQEQAVAETAEILAATNAIKTAAVADALRVLILADVIEQGAAAEAINALTNAGLIEASALAEATVSVKTTINTPGNDR